jgi:predicted nucleic acid-binding protein
LVRKAAPLTLDLAYLEAVNVLWKHIAVLKRVPEEEWEERSGLLKDLIYTYSEVHRAEEQLPKALKLALEAHIPVYDAIYVQLAHSAGSRLLTTDVTLAGKLEGTKYGELVRVVSPD